MWHIAEFESTTFFSLRPANATTSGGKTLITPTPFAVKMALLDAAIRIHGAKAGERWFPWLRDLQVAVTLPQHLVVINTFIRILRPHKSGTKDTYGTGLEGPMGKTIAFREMVHFGGTVKIAVRDVHSEEDPPPFEQLITQIHYLGKRGGFMQFRNLQSKDSLPATFTLLNPTITAGQGRQFDVRGMLQLLDDCGSRMSFAHADIFSGKRLLVGKPNGRILNPIVLPYRLAKSSSSYSLYQRIEG